MKTVLFLSLLITSSSYAASFYCTLDKDSPREFPQGVVEVTKTHINFRSGKFQINTKISDATKNNEVMVGTTPGGHMTNFNRYTGDFTLMIPTISFYKCSKKEPLI